MWRPGRRLFTVACILILITAALHTVGNWSWHNDNAEETNLYNTMQNFHFKMGPMSPSFYELVRALIFTMTITFVALGVIGLMLAASSEVSVGLIKHMTWVNLLWMLAFTVLVYYYQVLPPLTCAVPIDLVLIAALVIPTKNTA